MKRILSILLTITTLSLSSQTIYEVDSVLKEYGVKHSDIVLKQSILETGWYKSRLCKEYKNIFGFWYKDDFLKFDCWEDSVAYYARWQARHFDDECCDDYYDFLVRRGYAEDPKYIDKLKSIKI
jgi:flagellum-specific peptidoglycan hydrolase FlgJ